MKKLLCIVFAVCVLLTVAGCGRGEKNPVLGAWEAETQISILGVSGNQTVDAVYRFEFFGDGTGKSQIDADSNLPDPAGAFTYVLEEDQLVLTFENGMTQTFAVTFGENTMTLEGRANLDLVRVEN